MINILLIGCLGRLGSEINDYVANLENYQIVAGLDTKNNISKQLSYKIYHSDKEILKDNIIADIVIDFSNTSALKSTLNYCSQTSTPLVLGTTDISDNDKINLLETSKQIPIFWSVNMSIGVNILANLCSSVISLANNNCDIDIIEKHHRNKLDAPSGTATLIANLIKLQSDKLYDTEKIISNNNHNLNDHRSKNEIRVHSIRSGNITGQHDIIFNIGDEILTLSHIASCKKVFAQGAITAANFIINQEPGLYGTLNEINIK